jgi:serine/threonine protein kinase/tetratricopeptide (TPR) repeat protein
MTPERWQRIKELFLAALEREPGERAAFIDAACAGDAETRAEVASLVAAHERDGEFIDAPAAVMAARLAAEEQGGFEAGRRVGSYEIVSTLGEGGMGKVYLARDARLGRNVALKLLPASFTCDPDRVRRFEQEARAASALNHPNILTIHEIGEEGEARFIATEYVEGETLRERLRRGEVPPAEALDVAVQVAAALAAAHAAHVIHRDIKPENLIVRADGYVKVLDFGLAKLARPARARTAADSTEFDSLGGAFVDTSPGVVMGTAAYMSPEQARGYEVDERADVWSLGCVLYEMVAARQPFTGPTPSDVMAAVLQREPPPLGGRGTSIPAELERITLKALAKEREERYQSVREMLLDLRRLRQRMEFEAEMSRARGGADGDSSAPTPSGARPPAEQLKQVTVLFADLYGLAALGDTLDAEEMGEVTRELWERVDAAVMGHGGAVESHLGGQVLARWGTASAREDDPEQAVRAALRMQEEVGEFVRRGLRDARGAEVASGRVMRIGVNTGAVLLSAVGGGATATGATVNAAQRLAEAAPVGGVLISHDTYRHVRGVFDVRETELPNIRGQAEPAGAFLVERAKPRSFRLRTRGVEGVETRMVGRQAELARLRDALQTVIEDRELQAVTVLGEAGLGKTRLLDEFGAEVELLPERALVFQGRAGQWARGLPYALLRDVLSHRFAIQDSDPPATAREKMERGLLELFGGAEDAQMRAHFVGHLAGLDFSASPHLAGVLADAKQVRGRAFTYAAQLFRDAAASAPAVLYLEDLHWADDGSLDFVDHLWRACADAPLLVLCFARPDLLERRPAWGEGLAAHARLTLQPLTRRESRQLVEEILRYARSVPHALREMVVSAAEGNPFYVEELIKMLIDQGVIVPDAADWHVDASRLVEVRVPPTLKGVLQARLDGLTVWEKTVLQRASVVGREFWDGALEEFSRAARARGEAGEGEVAPALATLRRKEFIFRRESSTFTGAAEYTFKHALLRSVTYENTLKRERRRLHREAAEWLISRSDARVEEYAAVIAEHFERAREWGRAAEWYGRAGQQARTSYAPEAAIDFYRKALDFARDAGEAGAPSTAREEIRWHDGLGEVLTMQARYAEAMSAYEQMREAAESVGDPVAQARAWNGLTAVREYQGDNRAALESASRAEHLALAAGEVPAARSELAVALNRHGLASHRLGDAASVTELGLRLIALSEQMDDGRRHARANGLRLLGVAHETSGRFAEADECFEQSLALLRETGDRRNVGFMLNNLGVVAHLRGDYEAAVARYGEALSIFRETGERTCELPGLGNLAGAQVGLGEYAAAEANLRQAIAWAGPAGHFALSMIYCYLAESLCGQGKIDDALEAARAALDLGLRTENQDYIGSAWRALGLIASRSGSRLLFNGRQHTAAECFAESLRVYAEMGAEAERARTLRDWAGYELREGDAQRGASLWDEARAVFTHLGMERELERMSPPS